MTSTTPSSTPFIISSITVHPECNRFSHGGLCGKLLAYFCFLILPLSADQFEDFTYTDNGTTITIDGYTGFGGFVDIPADIVGKPVTEIGDRAFFFADLTSVTIPSSVIHIGEYAFGHCGELTDVTIPASVSSFGRAPFGGCGALITITVAPANPNFSSSGGVLFNKLNTTLVQFPGGLGGAYAIPASVTRIEEWAFDLCGLTSVSIPSGVTNMGAGPFYRCSALVAITVASGNPNFSSSGGVLFNKLQTALIQFPGGVGGAYVIPASVTSIGNYAFDGSGLTSVTFPSSMTSIGEGAFVFCSGLTSVTIPSSVTHISNFAFGFCENLTSATFLGPAPLTVGEQVFEYAASAFTIYYSGSTSGFSSPTWLGYPAVDLFVPEITVELPSTPALADGSSVIVFQSTAAGSAITKTFTIRNDGQQPLNGLALSKVGPYAANFTLGTLGATSLAAGASTTFDVTCTPQAGSPQIATLRIASDDADENPFDIALNGSIAANVADFSYTDNGTTITIDSYIGAGGAVSIPSSITGKPVTNIGASAFQLRPAITSMTIPASVTSIGNSAFSKCINMTSLTIPSGVTTIGSRAFEECSGLTSVIIPSSVTSIGSYAFNDCTALTSVVLPSSVTSIADYTFSACTGLTSVTIPASVTSIGNRAFEYCWKLPNITIPSSVTSIGFEAFTNCSLLTSATFLGNAPAMGSNVFASTATAFTVYYSPGASGFASPTWLGYPAVEGTVEPPQEITVELSPAGTPLVDGLSEIRFESQTVGTAVIKTFLIRNDGDAPITGLSLSQTGPFAANFTMGALGATTLASGASTTFDVTCTPQAGATQTATLRIAKTEAVPNPFDIGLTARVVTINDDDFNDDSKNLAKWGPDFTSNDSPPHPDTNGSLTETNSRLEYTPTAETLGLDTYRPWINQATYDKDWELIMDVRNSLTWSSGTHDTGMGIQIFPPGTLGQSFFTEKNAACWEDTLDFSVFYGFVSGQGEDEAGVLDQKLSSPGADGSIRIAFNSTTKVLTTYCDTDGSANGEVWTPLATFGINGSGGARNANWNMSGSQVFQIAVYGFSDNSAVTSGQMFADNFSMITPISGPPTSTVQSWQIAKFGSASDPEAALDFDADKDGLLNVLEYAFKLEPEIPGTPILTTLTGTSGLPRITPIGTGPTQRLRLEYVRMKASTNPGITYIPQFSSSLQGSGTGGWSASTGPETVQSIDTEWERVVVEDTAGIGLPGRFGRVVVTAP